MAGERIGRGVRIVGVEAGFFILRCGAGATVRGGRTSGRTAGGGGVDGRSGAVPLRLFGVGVYEVPVTSSS